jgi:hypothetical protein
MDAIRGFAILLLPGVVALLAIRLSSHPRVQRLLAVSGVWFPLLLWAVVLRLIWALRHSGNVGLVMAALALLPIAAGVLTLTWRDVRRRVTAEALARTAQSELPARRGGGAGAGTALASPPHAPGHEAHVRDAAPADGASPAGPGAPRPHPNDATEWT